MNNSKTDPVTKFETVRHFVLANLQSREHLRNDDSKLIATIWFQQLGKQQVNQMSGFDMLQAFADNKLFNPESIRRMRQKLQEEFPELRGKSYLNRQHAANRVRKSIKSDHPCMK